MYRNLDDTIFAPITGSISGSVCVFRISGKNAFKITSILDRKIDVEHSKSYVANIVDGENILDHVIINFYQNPKSFTGQDVVEINLHASHFIASSFVSILEKLGFYHASGGEFTYRAVLNGKMDIVQSESIKDIIESETHEQHKLAMSGLLGKISDKYRDIINSLRQIHVLIEANIDFSDQDIDPETFAYINEKVFSIRDQVSRYINGSENARRIQNGYNISIFGEPNVGKSSILNMLSNQDIAIVSDEAGTTRDIVQSCINVKGFKVNFYDTAGLRETDNKIEKIGIDKALLVINNSDLKILVLDIANISIPSNIDIKDCDIIIFNKADIDYNNDAITEFVSKNGVKLWCKLSTISNIGFDELINLIHGKISTSGNDDAIIISQRQLSIMKKALPILENLNPDNMDIEILAEELRYITNLITSIVEPISADDILGDIFSNFCIGK
jgi:tRNA modification GTPase